MVQCRVFFSFSTFCRLHFIGCWRDSPGKACEMLTENICKYCRVHCFVWWWIVIEDTIWVWVFAWEKWWGEGSFWWEESLCCPLARSWIQGSQQKLPPPAPSVPCSCKGWDRIELRPILTLFAKKFAQAPTSLWNLLSSSSCCRKLKAVSFSVFSSAICMYVEKAGDGYGSWQGCMYVVQT
jgi:hypothetical protein